MHANENQNFSAYFREIGNGDSSSLDIAQLFQIVHTYMLHISFVLVVQQSLSACRINSKQDEWKLQRTSLNKSEDIAESQMSVGGKTKKEKKALQKIDNREASTLLRPCWVETQSQGLSHHPPLPLSPPTGLVGKSFKHKHGMKKFSSALWVRTNVLFTSFIFFSPSRKVVRVKWSFFAHDRSLTARYSLQLSFTFDTKTGEIWKRK